VSGGPQKQLAADFPTRPEFRQELAMSYNNLGALLERTGRFKEAEVAYQDALALQKQLAADFPGTAKRQWVSSGERPSAPGRAVGLSAIGPGY
jgi:hypothetical protein